VAETRNPWNARKITTTELTRIRREFEMESKRGCRKN
jgi:hypothetical protein